MFFLYFTANNFFFNCYLHYEFEIYLFKSFDQIQVFSKNNIVVFSNGKQDSDFYFNIRMLEQEHKNIKYIRYFCSVVHFLYSFFNKQDVIINKNILFFLISKLNIEHIFIIKKIFNISNINSNDFLSLIENKFLCIDGVMFIIIDDNWNVTRNLSMKFKFSNIIFYYDNNLHSILAKYVNYKRNLGYAFRLKNYLLK